MLGDVVIDDAGADHTLGTGQARELLAFLVSRRAHAASTDEVVAALWDCEPPPTAPTIVHGLVRRIRQALGATSIEHDRAGYRLGLPADQVDLWTIQDLIAAGSVIEARSQWREPPFGAYADRRWALAAAAPTRSVIAPDAPGVQLRTRQRVPVRRLVGRRRELAGVQAAIRRSRLVTLVGLGGVGKTRLALEVALGAEVRVTHVDVSAAVGPVACRVATELGQASSGDPTTDLRACASLIGRDARLLVLDGCDADLRGSATVVEQLLAACLNLTVLATSRVALGLPGEHVAPILPFPDPGDPRGDTVELLLDRARAMGWEPGPADRQTAAEIGARTAGVPLAIELGAIELLLPKGTSADPRPTPDDAVDVAVAGAVAQLSEPSRTTAVRAACLVAGFTTELATSLVPAGGSAVGVLQELVAGGLVAVETTGTSRRIRFFDRVREELLGTGEDADERAALDAVLTLLRAARPDLTAPRVVPALSRAIDELANVDGLLERLVAQGRTADRVELVVAAADTWGEDGRWTSGPREVEAALDAAPDLEPLSRARAVRAWAAAMGTYDGVRRLLPQLEQAAAVAREAGELPLEAHLRLHLANAHGYGGRMADAMGEVARLRELTRAIDVEYVGFAVESLDGVGRLVAGDHERAQQLLDSLADRVERAGAPSDAARLFRMSSLASRALGNLPAALQSLQRAERLAAASLARGTLATVRTDLAVVQLRLGDPHAADVLQAALDASLAVGNVRAAGIARTRLGHLLRDEQILSQGALDLWFADRRWAAASVVRLADVLGPDHPLHRSLGWAVPALIAGWGTPLDEDAQALVAPYLQCEEPPPPAWEDELHGLIQAVGERAD